MPRIVDVCRYVRSKNAGPFWITVDLFFRDRATFDEHVDDDALAARAVAPLLGAEPAAVRRFTLPDLAVVKFSLPRAAPQGGAVERDMHGGQRFVPLLQVELASAARGGR